MINQLEFVGQHWAIVPRVLHGILAAHEVSVPDLLSMAEGGPDAIELESRNRVPRARANLVAILPMYGIITHRPNLLTRWGLATSAETFGEWLDEAVADDKVKAIVIDCHSPGGSVHGMRILAQKIFEARNPEKPIVAVANDYMFSAAYWACASADRVMITPGGMAGSIGVVFVHTEYAKADAAAGVTNTVISQGRYKAEGNEYEKLGDEARAEIQRQVDTFYAQFVDDVARGRGVDPAAVEKGFGQGRTFIDDQAVTAGLADGVASMPEVVGGLMADDGTESGVKAAIAYAAAAEAGERIHEANPMDLPEALEETRQAAARLQATLDACNVGRLRRALGVDTRGAGG